MSVRERAARNRGMAQRQSNQPPSPVRRCEQGFQLILGCFFDGTGNNMYVDRRRGAETNVVRLLDYYRQGIVGCSLQWKHYITGIGSRPSSAWIDIEGTLQQSFGLGGRDKIIAMYDWVKEKCDGVSPTTPKVIDIYGFSRGAALARTFVNIVNLGLTRFVQNVRVRFVGLFDTVAQFGAPGDNVEPGQNMYVDGSDAAAIYQFTAEDEIRRLFPLTRTPFDHPYVGVHSDIGGGYPPGYQGRENILSWVTCMDMHWYSVRSGVGMRPFGILTARIQQLKAEAQRFDLSRPRRRNPRPPMTGDQYNAFYYRYVHQSHDTGSVSSWSVPGGVRVRFQPMRRKTLRVFPREYEWNGD